MGRDSPFKPGFGLSGDTALQAAEKLFQSPEGTGELSRDEILGGLDGQEMAEGTQDYVLPTSAVPAGLLLVCYAYPGFHPGLSSAVPSGLWNSFSAACLVGP
jgi:hypothetical protein